MTSVKVATLDWSSTTIGLTWLPSNAGAQIRGTARGNVGAAIREIGRARLTRRNAVRTLFESKRMLERVGG
jgi:hypothetical protein